ncbi:MAG: hypothetical protein DRO87_12715 [Candidatus Thorarchaeota archaeon]|nr:MAG: hypothetical protein DRO87_12715 [Candidatus Thorarchaeota archaeon]RLI52786.1 MAG: hypothetical protein DRP09_17210 [Candidatus Thorarchaeota archaeon]
MIRMLFIVLAGLVNKSGLHVSPRRREDLLSDDSGRNIKQMTLDLMISSLQQISEDFDAILEKYREAFDVFGMLFDKVKDRNVQHSLEGRYGPVLASNFGLAMNTMMALFRLLKEKMAISAPSDIRIESDLLASILQSPQVLSYPDDAELPDPSEMLQGTDPIMDKMVQSVVFSCNVTSFSTLVLLTMSLADAQHEMAPAKIGEMEELLRDWTLDILIQVRELLDSDLEVREPLSIAVPSYAGDRVLAEVGLDDYVERLE